jgi:hypothetical protein
VIAFISEEVAQRGKQLRYLLKRCRAALDKASLTRRCPDALQLACLVASENIGMRAGKPAEKTFRRVLSLFA